MDEPDFALVDVAVAMPPPLAERQAARRDRNRRPVGRRCGPVLRRIPIRCHRHRCAALGTHAKDVAHAGDVARRGGEVEPLSVVRPAVELVVRIVERDALQLTRGERQHVDVAVAGAGRHEREPRAIGRPFRPALVGRMRHEKSRVAASKRHRPDVAAGYEDDLLVIGRETGLGKGWRRRCRNGARWRWPSGEGRDRGERGDYGEC